MIREIVKIDEELCDGCALCIPNCHEGALQIIDGKARLISDLMCDGLGACLGHCPQDAITIEKREAEPYDEIKVMKIMVEKGKNTVIAHLKHLKEHNETDFLNQAINFLNDNKMDFEVDDVLKELNNNSCGTNNSGGCPGSKTMTFDKNAVPQANMHSGQSELTHWPIQMHLINPAAPHFNGSDMVLAADCVAFSLGNFHSARLKGKTLGIACPKLDDGLEIYASKIKSLIDDAKINTLTVMIMTVPCCRGLLQIVQQAVASASRKVPVKAVVVDIKGEVVAEEWV